MVNLLLAAIILAPWPKNIAVSAGGLNATDYEPTNACWRDPKTGYYIYKNMECDGGHRAITITKDRRVLEEAGYDTTRFGRKPKEWMPYKIETRPFPASAGNGVRMGMTKSSLLKKLGKPAKTAVRGKRGEFWCALYKKADLDAKKEGQVLRNTYIFKNGRLVEMKINLDSVPGCGDDSLSDAGWPWTKF